MELKYGKDNIERLPLEFYLEKFKGIDPLVSAERLGIPYDEEKQEFTVSFLGETYQISWPDYNAVPVEGRNGYYPACEETYAKVLVMRYLIQATTTAFDGRFMAFREFSGGDLYFRPFQGRCIFRMNRKYGSRTEVFARLMEKLGAVKASQGDISYDLEIFPEFWVRFIIWEGDEEFPASTQILFSANFPLAFDTYDLVECAEITMNTMGRLEKMA